MPDVEAPSTDRSDLLARMRSIMEKTKTRPEPVSPASAPPPARLERHRDASSSRTEEVYGGPPGPAPSEGGCGHASSMRYWERNGVHRARCGACGAEWKLAERRGRLGMVVVRRAL